MDPIWRRIPVFLSRQASSARTSMASCIVQIAKTLLKCISMIYTGNGLLDNNLNQQTKTFFMLIK